MSFLTSSVIQIYENYFMLILLKSMQIFLVSKQFLESMQISVVSMQFFLKSLQLQKIIVKEQVEQNFFWRNLALQEGRMCEGGPLPLHALFAQALNGLLLCEALCEAKA